MPKKKRTPFPKGYTDWNYNWALPYNHTTTDIGSLSHMYPDDKRLSMDNVRSIAESADSDMLDSEEDVRYSPNLILPQRENKVSCRKLIPTTMADKNESRELQEENINILRDRLSKFSAALDEKQLAMARENPEGASFLRFIRDRSNFALQHYGSEAFSDVVFTQIDSQTGALHLPDGTENRFRGDRETRENRKSFTRIIDHLSDMPFLPVYENASRMVNIASDHANAARTGTLTKDQDRLSRRLLLIQYDQIDHQIGETLRVVIPDNAKDYDRWSKVMDNEPYHVSTYERGPFRLPYDLEGRRIALRQGWPVADTMLLGSLFYLQNTVEKPSASRKERFPDTLRSSFNKLIADVSSTQITGPKVRMNLLNRIEVFLKNNQKVLNIDGALIDTIFRIRNAEKIQTFEYLSRTELDDAAREYESRKSLPKTAGSDGAPIGYFEQAVAGTEVLSRLTAMYEVMAKPNQKGKDLKEYNDLRNATSGLIRSISVLYGPNPPKDKARTELMDALVADHAKLSRLAQAYLGKATKREPAFKTAVARELEYFCDRTAKTAAATKEGLEIAENRRRLQDWRKEKENAKSVGANVEAPKVEDPKVDETKVDEPKVDETKVDQPKVDEPNVDASKVEDPKVDETKVDGPKVDETKVEEPKIEDPKVDQPKVDQPKADETKVEEPKVDGPKVDEPKVDEPKVDEPKVDGPKVEDPKVDQPKVDQPKVDEPKVDEPKVHETKVDQPKVDEPKVDEPKVHETKVDQPKVDEPKVDQPKVDQPKVDEPKVDEPAAQPDQERNITIDISGLKPEVVGTESDRRYGFKIPVEDGRIMDGFFTPDVPLMEESEELDVLKRRIAKISPDAAKAIRLMEEKSKSFQNLSGLSPRSLATWQRQTEGKYWNFLEYDNRFKDCLEEAGFSDKTIKAMTNQTFASAIDDYLTSRARIKNRDKLYKNMNIQPGDTTALRSGAMSAVADALGVGSLLAASRPLTLIRNNTPVYGVFTDRPVGSDCMNPAKDDPILQMTPDTAYSPKAMRELASIQVLDYICGNVDRQPGSLRYSFARDDKGKLVLDGIQGVDNSLSFMGCQASARISENQVYTHMLRNMPKSLADRVSQLNSESLKNALREFHLSEEQVKQATERLKHVQQQIRGGEEYFKDKDANAHTPEYIHVLPDEEYAKLSPNDLTFKKALDTTIRDVKAEREQLAQQRIFMADERKLSELWTKAEASDKSVWFGSKEFADMKEALHDVGYKHCELMEGNRWNTQIPMKIKTLTNEALEDLRFSYQKLSSAADAYLIRKEKEEKQKGSLDQKSRARVEIAKQIKEMLQPQADHIASLANAQRREADALNKMDMNQLRREMDLGETTRKRAKDNIEKSQPQKTNQRSYSVTTRTSAPVKSSQTKKNVNTPPTARERLDKLLGTLAEQRSLQKLVKDKQLDRKAPGVLSRQELAEKLVEAFAVVEIANAAGSVDIRVDDNCLNLMRTALRTDARKNPEQLESYKKQLTEVIPDADLKQLHQNNYADMRAAIKQSMTDPAKVGERLEMMTDYLKEPSTVFGKMQGHAEKLENENEQAGLKKTVNKKSGNKLGM